MYELRGPDAWANAALIVALRNNASALLDRIAELEGVLAGVLPFTEAERLAEASAVRCGAIRNPIAKAVTRAANVLSTAINGKAE